MESKARHLRVVLLKPSKYSIDGTVERWRQGFMPNATLYHLAGLTPSEMAGRDIELHLIDEYVHTTLDYLKLLEADSNSDTLLALVGIQSHQFQRAMDLAAYALAHGVNMVVAGGPHPMTCDTSMLHGKGVSFALAEGEQIWPQILRDACDGEILPIYGEQDSRRWADQLAPVVVTPPAPHELSRYWAPMIGLYPVRGCPYSCNYCSVIKISGQQVRSAPIQATLESLRKAVASGVDTVMFVSDNFNKYPEAPKLLNAIIEQNISIRFFVQCDTQISQQPELIDLLGRAGCFEIFLGVESFSRAVLKSANKFHNHPDRYANIVSMCQEAGIRVHFSNIIGFPQDTAASIEEHLSALKELAPEVVSFYILTPIPGTDQYDEYLNAGLIWEDNLDRFDASCPTWKHPTLKADELTELMYGAYDDYYTHLLRTQPHMQTETRNIALMSRVSARDHIHPMSGGIGPVKKDSRDDYLPLRRNLYGLERFPLPRSLPKPTNTRKVKLKKVLSAY